MCMYIYTAACCYTFSRDMDLRCIFTVFIGSRHLRLGAPTNTRLDSSTKHLKSIYNINYFLIVFTRLACVGSHGWAHRPVG